MRWDGPHLLQPVSYAAPPHNPLGAPIPQGPIPTLVLPKLPSLALSSTHTFDVSGEGKFGPMRKCQWRAGCNVCMLRVGGIRAVVNGLSGLPLHKWASLRVWEGRGGEGRGGCSNTARTEYSRAWAEVHGHDRKKTGASPLEKAHEVCHETRNRRMILPAFPFVLYGSAVTSRDF